MKNHNYIRRKSNKQEARIAKDFGGKTRPGSGNMEFAKGDVRTGETTSAFNVEDFLIENKYTDAPAYKLTTATWKKIEREAFRENMRTPMMQIDVQDVQLVVLNHDDFKAMGLINIVDIINVKAIPNKSHALKGEYYGSLIVADLNVGESLLFPNETLHLVIMGYDDLKRILF